MALKHPHQMALKHTKYEMFGPETPALSSAALLADGYLPVRNAAAAFIQLLRCLSEAVIVATGVLQPLLRKGMSEANFRGQTRAIFINDGMGTNLADGSLDDMPLGTFRPRFQQ